MKSSVILSLILFWFTLSMAEEYFQQEVDYKITITLDPKSKTYQGREIMNYKNNSPTKLDFIWIHLYPNAYKDGSTPFARQENLRRNRSFHFSKQSERGFLDIDSVFADGQMIHWETKAEAIDEIKLILANPLNPGASVEIVFYFKGKFPKIFSRMGYFAETFFAATQWYPKAVVFDKEGWHPDSYLDVGEFYGEFGNYDVAITLPKEYVIDATGMLLDNPQEETFIQTLVDSTKKFLALESEKERNKFLKRWNTKKKAEASADSLKTVRFQAEHVHDFAWFAGERYMMLQTLPNDSVLINVLVRPPNAYAWKDVPKYVEKTISFFGEAIGKYQYPKASVVDGGPEGVGMEYPMITLISMPAYEWTNLLESTVMHEIGHNWFYGMLGNNERRDPFLDEGLNSFYEYKYMLKHYGFNNLTNFNKLFKGQDILKDIGQWHLIQLAYGMTVNENTGQPLKLRAEEFTPSTYGAITYQKSVTLLLALEWLVGENIFQKAIQTYFERWNGKHPTTEDFFGVMAEISGQNLDWFIEEWYNKTTYNDFKIRKKKTERMNDSFTTTIFLQNKGSMVNMPAPVHLLTENLDTLEGRWSGKEDEPVIINHQDPLKKIEANLKRTIFESNYLNNSSWPEFDFNLIGQIPRFDTYPINVLPYYWYEYFKDKNRIGLGFWSGNPFFNQYFAHGSVYLGTASQNIGYDFNIINRFNSFFSNFIDAAARIKDMDGLKRYSLELKSVTINPQDNRYNYAVTLSLDHIKLYDLDYNQPGLFQKARYLAANLTFYNKFRRLLYFYQTKFSLEYSPDVLGEQTHYTKTQLDFFYKRYISQKSYFTFSLYGAAIWGEQIISQELIYAGGEVDPKHKLFAIGRRGSIAPLRNWAYGSGMNMPGYSNIKNPYSTGQAGASSQLKFKLSFLPAIYGSLGTISPTTQDFGQDFFAEYGIIIGNENLSFIFPVYLTDPAAGEKHLDFRFFFNFRSPITLSY